MFAEESEPESPQGIGSVQHDFHQPAGMGAGMESQRQLHDVFEIIGQDRLALAMRQLVGVSATAALHRMVNSPNATQPPAGATPTTRQRPGCRLAGRARRRYGRTARVRRIARRPAANWRRQNPAQPRLFAEQFEDAGVKAQHGHAGRIRGDSGPIDRAAF